MIYVMHSERQQVLKIGIAKDIDKRLMTLRTSCSDREVLRQGVCWMLKSQHPATTFAA
ncbi:GIY-YIG nuclease family protein [Leptolyngbya sp. GGD]|uniref:GIY-YIG nuclease family protein n=1 Tax=Leptolyngbya sp. GGD TaxID=2997907 RepID=UPI003FA37555